VVVQSLQTQSREPKGERRLTQCVNRSAIGDESPTTTPANRTAILCPLNGQRFGLANPVRLTDRQRTPPWYRPKAQVLCCRIMASCHPKNVKNFTIANASSSVD